MADYQMADAEPETDRLSATEPVRPWAAALGRGLKVAHEFVSEPFGYSNPPGRAISEAVGIPQAGRVMEDVGYGTTHMMENTARGREWRMQAAEAMPTLATGAKAAGKAAWEAAGKMPRVPHGQVQLFLTPGERQAPMLSKAREMEAHGAPPEQVWAETGMLRWTDGTWRYETDDSKAALKVIDKIKEERAFHLNEFDSLRGAIQLHAWMKGGKSASEAEAAIKEAGLPPVKGHAKEYAEARTMDELQTHLDRTWKKITEPLGPRPIQEVFSHPELEQDIPGMLEGVKMETFDPKTPRHRGYFKPKEGVVGLSTTRLADTASSKGTTLHELQHLHDNLMGLDYGSNPDVVKQIAKAQGVELTDEQAFELYKLNAGEALARLSQRRAPLTAEDRRAHYPMRHGTSYGLDVDPERMHTMQDIVTRGVSTYNTPKE
jgi:hypothetical protein